MSTGHEVPAGLVFQPSPALWRGMRALLGLSERDAAERAGVSPSDLSRVEGLSYGSDGMFTSAGRQGPAMAVRTAYAHRGGKFRLWSEYGLADVLLPARPEAEWWAELGCPSPGQFRAARALLSLSVEALALAVNWPVCDLVDYETTDKNSPRPDVQPIWWGGGALFRVAEYFRERGVFMVDPRLSGKPEFGVRFRIAGERSLNRAPDRIVPEQFSKARGIAGWDEETAAAAADIPLAMLANLEGWGEIIAARHRLASAYNAAGIEFSRRIDWRGISYLVEADGVAWPDSFAAHDDAHTDKLGRIVNEYDQN